MEDGVDIRAIQALLGHAKLDSTALYAKVAVRTVRAVNEALARQPVEDEAACRVACICMAAQVVGKYDHKAMGDAPIAPSGNRCNLALVPRGGPQRQADD